MSSYTRNPEIKGQDLVLRSRTNWTAVTLFGCLAAVHFVIAWLAGRSGHYEGTVSLLLGIGFSGVALAYWSSMREITLLRKKEIIRVRSGCRILQSERRVPFNQVRAVRLILGDESGRRAKLQLLCDTEELDCPLTCSPRQQALCLAVVLNVRLVRIHGDGDFLNDPARQGLQ